jgi:hypothetical protein
MTTIENSGSPQTAIAKTGWFRRAAMGTAFAAVGILSLGAATTPAQAYWYGYGYHPYYAYYPHYYGWHQYHPVYYGWGYGWRGGWGWRHGWYHHW